MNIPFELADEILDILREANQHLDRDFNWEEADKYEERVLAAVSQLEIIVEGDVSHEAPIPYRDPKDGTIKTKKVKL